MNLLKKLGSFVKIEHSLFSLPLLFAGALLAQDQLHLPGIPWGKWALIVMAGTGARVAALALNRLIDRTIDAKNPRTSGRELPSGSLTPTQGWGMMAMGSAVYLFGAAMLGRTCLVLSPIPLAVFIVYPLMKRFTWLAHIGVGTGLALAPLGGYIGITGALPPSRGAWWLAGFALCWVAGFDVLYSTLDEQFDRKEGLHSISVQFGAPAAQDTALMLHALAFFCLSAMRWASFHSKPAWIWIALVPSAVLLTLEQRSGYHLDQNSAFFKINAWIGVAVLGYVIAGVM
jgi:4-hydroxybenzoate polyprenyltransferase